MNLRTPVNLQFIHPAVHLFAGPSGCGKTSRTCAILRAKNSMIQEGNRIKNIVFCYASWQTIYEDLKKDQIVTKFVKVNPSVKEFIKLVEEFTTEGGSILVIDDFMTKLGADIVDIVCVHSRHLNTSLFILQQNLFPPGPFGRQVSLNAKYLHVHKNPRENAQIGYLARQLQPGNSKWIHEAFKEATFEPYSAFLIDLTQERDDRLRLRSHYLPKDLPMRAYMSSEQSRFYSPT